MPPATLFLVALSLSLLLSLWLAALRLSSAALCLKSATSLIGSANGVAWPMQSFYKEVRARFAHPANRKMCAHCGVQKHSALHHEEGFKRAGTGVSFHCTLSDSAHSALSLCQLKSCGVALFRSVHPAR